MTTSKVGAYHAKTHLAQLLDRVMGSEGDEGECAAVREEVRAMCAEFPLP